jgi:hypothetical protein
MSRTKGGGGFDMNFGSPSKAYKPSLHEIRSPSIEPRNKIKLINRYSGSQTVKNSHLFSKDSDPVMKLFQTSSKKINQNITKGSDVKKMMEAFNQVRDGHGMDLVNLSSRKLLEPNETM